MIRVLVADDHPAILLGLETVLEGESDLDLCGSALDGESACDLAVRTVPDVVVMDVSMPGMGGIEATRRIVHEVPGARVVILTWSTDPATRELALAAGASDFLLKDVGVPELLEAIRATV